MLRGALKAEYRRCGKADCPCAHDKDKRHGPYYYLVWQEAGRRKRVYVPREQVEEVRAAIAERREFMGEMRRAVRGANQACREAREVFSARFEPSAPPRYDRPTGPEPAPDGGSEVDQAKAARVFGILLQAARCAAEAGA